ncbi:hypothetical protein ACFQY7_26395 [Actinomadura luteofluorescens]|uniref:hypothetical protein n=1 Tax=Actinomadura luteofluorescens TaxID=46163 RepID=UPI00364132B1
MPEPPRLDGSTAAAGGAGGDDVRGDLRRPRPAAGGPWRRLGGGAPPVPLDVVDAQRLAIDLRLVPPMAARLPLPLVI